MPMLRNLLIALSLLPFMPLASAQVNKELPMIDLSIGGHKLRAEVANDTPTRTVGLMNRFSLKTDHGMLFVFKTADPLAFWMKNTMVALSIAFVGEDGVILNIADMKPQSEENTPSAGPALYALEMKKGWFAERNIKAGAKIVGLEKAAKAKD
jgi:uncharacterized protein